MIVLGKIVADIAAMSIAAWVGIVVAAESTPIAVSAIVAVLGFAGLLVRLVVKAQQAVWDIVEAKNAEIDTLREDLHYSEWEKERLRFTYGERVVDPGPFVPRKAAR